MTRAEALRQATARLRDAGLADPGRDARLLMRWSSGMSAAEMTAALTDIQTAEEADRLAAAVSERAKGRPVSQITGLREFWGRSFKVTPDVLDPRPETETLIAAALEGGPVGRVLDLGVGSGCILLTLLAEWPYATGLGIDISAAALDVARRNAEKLDVNRRAHLQQGDWFDGLDETFDLITSNPPYIADSEMPGLSASVREFEPREALTPGRDGLDAYRRIASGAAARLRHGGRVLVELGAGQDAAVEEIFADAGFSLADGFRDMDGRVRCLSLRRNHE